ncbi:hypothetical protein B9Z55_022620 [Caenorhabditis nigoni]|uniref:Uncharacterized protein n=1 Tax=Caenorhabditis nigoni TaxID=1611254 RepID=A0A2G5SLN2_9PELO|nr:hypothetical protein B9Z55_022620 [Caenorhabditis nigoni]
MYRVKRNFSKRWIINTRRYFVFYRIFRMRAYGGHDRIEAPDNDQDGQDPQDVHDGQDQDEQNENLPKSRSRKRRCHITVESPEEQPLQKRPRIKMESSEIYGEEEHYRWIKWKMDSVPEENLEEPEDVNEFENPEDQDFEEEQSDPIPEEPKNVEELEEMEREEDNRPPSPFEGVEIGVDVEIHLNNPVQFTDLLTNYSSDFEIIDQFFN